MPQRLPNYVRAARKEAGLSQGELAFLLGCRSAAKVSRYERFARSPGVPTIFACAIIFHIPPEKLFAGLYAAALSAVVPRATKLLREFNPTDSSPAATRKIRLLKTILKCSTEQDQAL